jgi:tRNA nucleotidyltransferase (CCA-adding enzyme)
MAQEQLQTIYEGLDKDPAAMAAYEALRASGGKVYVVGGAVRDALLGKRPKDIDLMVTGLSGKQITDTLSPLGRVDLTGQNFGVYRFRHNKSEVEIALPRTEYSTGSGHKDFQVVTDPNLDPTEDLGRRDFTANAMAMDLDTGELLDPHGGAEHIEGGRLSVVSPTAFEDDPLRIVRALVAYARHGLAPDAQTLQAMQDNAQKIRHLPGERIQMELDKLLASPNPASAIQLAHDSGVLAYMLPEVDQAFGFDQNNPYHDLEVGDHLLAVLTKMSELSGDPDLRLAALLHDIGKPDSYSENHDPEKAWVDSEGNTRTRGNFYERKLPDGTIVGADHETVGAQMAARLLQRLHYPSNRAKRIVDLIKHHMFDYLSGSKQARKLLRELHDEGDPSYGPRMAQDLHLLREADAAGKRNGQVSIADQRMLDRSKSLINDAIESSEAFSIRDLAVNGHDLMDAGVPPGPELGQILQRMLDLVVDHPELNDKTYLLGALDRTAMTEIFTITYPHPLLREVMPETTFEDAEATVETLLENVVAREKSGRPTVGLAANQIGIEQRVCMIQLDDLEWLPLINPYVVFYSPDKELGVEGCGSLPNLWLPIKRSLTVMVEHETTNGITRSSFNGWPARVAQHEVDHLDGILIIDRRDPVAPLP